MNGGPAPREHSGPFARQYVKLCDVRDFEDRELLRAIRALVPEREPPDYIERKVWEFAMVMMFLEEAGYLDGRAELLSVGAGDERILFWLTNHVGRMVATDIYGEGLFAHQEAQLSMLEDPAAHAPVQYGWRPDRLEVLKMDGRRLEFSDESFDAVFTVSSIEHFGSPAQIARAAAEIGRVLRPGGHAVVITECLVRLHPLDTAPVDFVRRLLSLGRGYRFATPRRRVELGEAFTPRELDRHLIAPSGLELIQPLDVSLSPESWENVTTQWPGGGLSSATGERFPLILMRIRRSVFTSVCLVLAKPRR